MLVAQPGQDVVPDLVAGPKQGDEAGDLALAPLGFAELTDWTDDATQVSFGPDDLDDFGLSTHYPATAGGHVAFAADSRTQVDAFHAAGGTDNGPPGIRTNYSPGYYGAFVLDPDGYNVEAVYHEPQAG